MEIYWGSGSPPCWKALIALHEKGFGGEPGKEKFKSNLITFSKQEHKSDAVKAINPRGQVPTFKDGDTIVNESSAIIFYLEKKYKDKGTKLIPDDAKSMGEVMQRFFEIESSWMQKFFQPIVRRIMTEKEENRPALMESEEITKAFEAAKEELQLYEGYLQKYPGGFIAGKSFTVADVSLIAYLGMLNRFGCEFSKFKNVKAYFDKVMAREAVKRTKPPHWAEADAPMKVFNVLDK